MYAVKYSSSPFVEWMWENLRCLKGSLFHTSFSQPKSQSCLLSIAAQYPWFLHAPKFAQSWTIMSLRSQTGAQVHIWDEIHLTASQRVQAGDGLWRCLRSCSHWGRPLHQAADASDKQGLQKSTHFFCSPVSALLAVFIWGEAQTFIF